MERRYIAASIAILAAFSIGLVGFFLVSDGSPDGLDKTLNEYGKEESEPVWSAPLDYGTSYGTTLIMGIVGFIITLVAMIGLIKLRKTMRSM